MNEPTDCVRLLSKRAAGLRLAYRRVGRAGAVDEREEQVCAGWADRRKAEFRTGRACAHELLASLGAAPSPIGVDSEGAPCWPAGFVGSISHKRGFCLVGVASRSSLRAVGLDLERDAHDAELVADIASDEELASVRAVAASPALCALLLLSAKEAAYKCQYALTGAVLAWRDVVVTFAADTFAARVPDLEGIQGIYVLADGWLVTAAIVK